MTGLKTIKKMLDKDPSNSALKDKLMEVYDLRINYFGGEAKVLNRKAYDAYFYFRSMPDRLTYIAGIFDRLYEIEKSGMSYNFV